MRLILKQSQNKFGFLYSRDYADGQDTRELKLPKKILAKTFLPKKIPEIENFKPKTILRSSLPLEIRSNPLGS